jgi:Dolichyl-phosphate-mannose-protein mannosyltransferase
MKFQLRWNRDAVFASALALAFLVGLWLRLYLLTDQVLIDDEWHGFYYAIGKSPAWLLTRFSIPGATCIPLNFYTWLLGATIGWSEFMLRLPSLICGLLCVLICPLLARKLIGTRRSVLLAFLLAICPTLIFYSRISRPYSAVAFLAFSVLLFAARRMQNGGWRNGFFFAVAGVLAIYFHLFAVVTVVAPLLAAFVLHVWKYFRKMPRAGINSPPLRQWIFTAAVMAGITAFLVLPALIHSLQSTFFTIALKGRFSLESLPQVALLISGTGQPVLAALFWMALVAGALEQCRRNPWFGWMLVGLYPLHALALIISRPDSAQSAIVLVRYSIPLVPVSLLFVACGIQSALEAIAARASLQPVLQILVAAACVAALAMTGPLPQCYVAPNNFTSHGAYQHRYGTIDWQRSFYSDFTPAGFTLTTTIRADEVSPFYVLLAKESGTRPVVEYPMLIGDHFNPLYYYQHFHRRPVIVGYTTGMALAKGLAPGNVYGNTYIDQVLSLVHDPSRIRFHNLISMDDLPAMRERGVEYVILHKRFEAQLSEVAPPPPDLERLWNQYHKMLGAPFYEDIHITVFRL